MKVRVLASLAAALIASAACCQDPLLWGSLRPGPFAVGFRSEVRFDFSRQYDSDYPLDPHRLFSPNPRPIVFAVWYPAARAVSRMPFSGYLDFHVTSESKRFLDRFKPFLRDRLVTDIFGKSESKLSPEQTAAYRRLLGTKTLVTRNAPPLKRTTSPGFPVVIDHPGLGGPYQDNSVFLEYLASHGYVVVSSAYQAPEGTKLYIDWNLDRSFADLSFLARAAGELPFADPYRIAVLGHSFGGQAAIAWASRPFGSTAAVVSLDSGLEMVPLTYPSFEPLKSAVDAGRGNLRCPVLRFTRQSEEHDFGYLEPYLRYADDYRSTVGGVEHNDFITDGAIRPALMPGEWPDKAKAAAVRRSYDRVCATILAFLDLKVKGLLDAEDRLVQGEKSSGDFTLEHRAGAPFPPTARQLAIIVRTKGVSRAMEILRGCRDDVAIGGDGIGGAASLLAGEGRRDQALDLVQQCTRMYPDSMTMFTIYGNLLTRYGRKQEAISAYLRSRANVQNEKADADTKARWTAEIEKKLRDLGWTP